MVGGGEVFEETSILLLLLLTPGVSEGETLPLALVVALLDKLLLVLDGLTEENPGPEDETRTLEELLTGLSMEEEELDACGALEEPDKKSSVHSP